MKERFTSELILQVSMRNLIENGIVINDFDVEILKENKIDEGIIYVLSITLQTNKGEFNIVDRFYDDGELHLMEVA